MLMYLGARSAFPKMALRLLKDGRKRSHATMWRIKPRNVEHVSSYIKNSNFIQPIKQNKQNICTLIKQNIHLYPIYQ